MKSGARLGASLVLVVLLQACGEPGPTSPTTQISRPPRVSPLPGPSRTFSFDRGLSPKVSGYTKASRFILYDQGAFVLQYATLGEEYRGRYTETDSVIRFEWDAWSAAGPWGATGTLDGDSLTVRYNLIMQLTDFEDAVYVRVP
jgi:hypothetical protein